MAWSDPYLARAHERARQRRRARVRVAIKRAGRPRIRWTVKSDRESR